MVIVSGWVRRSSFGMVGKGSSGSYLMGLGLSMFVVSLGSMGGLVKGLGSDTYCQNLHVSLTIFRLIILRISHIEPRS